MNSTSEQSNQIADHSDKVFWANTNLQPLDQHLYAVGYVAQQLYTRFYPEQKLFHNPPSLMVVCMILAN